MRIVQCIKMLTMSLTSFGLPDTHTNNDNSNNDTTNNNNNNNKNTLSLVENEKRAVANRRKRTVYSILLKPYDASTKDTHYSLGSRESECTVHALELPKDAEERNLLPNQ